MIFSPRSPDRGAERFDDVDCESPPGQETGGYLRDRMTPRPYAFAMLLMASTCAADVPTANVEGQPLGANVQRVIAALELLGTPLPKDVVADLKTAAGWKHVHFHRSPV